MAYRQMRRPANARGYESYRYSGSGTRQRIAGYVNTVQFAVVGMICGLARYAESEYYRFDSVYRVVAVSGPYVKVQQIARWIDGEPVRDADMYGVPLKQRWFRASLLCKLADTATEYGYVRKIASMEAEMRTAKMEAERIANQKAFELSKGTVTRALVHAYKNDYCSETAVALISAGHKMPDATVEFDVTLSVSVNLRGNDSYYKLRRLFGKADGDPTGEGGLVNSYDDGVEDMILEAIASDSFSLGSVQHTGTDIEFKQPTIRMTSFTEAAQLIDSSSE